MSFYSYRATTLGLICIVPIVLLCGCGGGGGGGAGKPMNLDQSQLDSLLKSLEAPPPEGGSKDNKDYATGKKTVIALIVHGGASAKPAIPALEKFRDSHDNPDLKKAADDAIAKLKGS